MLLQGLARLSDTASYWDSTWDLIGIKCYQLDPLYYNIANFLVLISDGSPVFKRKMFECIEIHY